MKRYLDDLVMADLPRKLVLLTGPRQVGKTTLARQLMAGSAPAVYLNWDVPSDRAVLQRQSWPRASRLVVLDEIHKMPGWKAWLQPDFESSEAHGRGSGASSACKCLIR